MTAKTKRKNARSGSSLTSFDSTEATTTTATNSSASPTTTLNDLQVGMSVATFNLDSRTLGARLLQRLKRSIARNWNCARKLRAVRALSDLIVGLGDYAILVCLFPALLFVWIATQEKEIED